MPVPLETQKGDPKEDLAKSWPSTVSTASHHLPPQLLRTTVQQAADAVDAPADFVQTLLPRPSTHMVSPDNRREAGTPGSMVGPPIPTPHTPTLAQPPLTPPSP